MRTVTIVLPIAHDLERDSFTHIVGLGPSTKKACDLAAEYALSHTDCVVLTTATKAGPEHDGVNMGKLMLEYLRTRYPELRVSCREAPSFNTEGEIIALARECHEKLIAPRTAERVVICVKDWHAARTSLLVKLLFKQWQLTPEVVIKTYHWPVSLLERAKEWMKAMLTPILVSRSSFD